MKKLFILLSFMTIALADVSGQKYKYETAPNDPTGTKIYTLKNGFKLYLSVFKDAPRVQTFIAVRAGSKNDPSETTGLAHYLEHMMFKGTRNIGALDWAKEEPLLNKISDLYEKYRATKDTAERSKIYAQIDATSQEAAAFVHTNEYDKMISSLGAKGTNAFTSLERTVYVNDIPSNEIEKWMNVEGERFREVVLRLFHTELEAVYEEFNIGQDNDGRNAYAAMLEGLFPTHTYGTQTTIGTSEHLKNPSLVNIQKFFKTYYVPNNMALIISGDFDPDQVTAWAEKYFGDYKPKDVPVFKYEEQKPIASPVVKEVFGKQQAWVDMAYRIPGISTKSNDVLLSELVAQVLANGQAGLIDLDLVQQQKVGSEAYAYTWTLSDYSLLALHAVPREGQSLEEAHKLLMDEIAKLRKGEFPDWLVEAAIKNLKLQQMKQMEDNRSRASYMLEAFITNQDWKTYNEGLAILEKFTKKDVVDYANKYLGDQNYVVVYKREGENKNVAKVQKPQITPLKVNRGEESAFMQKYKKITSPRLKPVFIDFKTAMVSSKLKSGVQVDVLPNTYNKTFELNYIVDMGKNHDKKLPLAIEYLKYLGTEKQSAEEIQQEFFKLGLAFEVFTSDDRCYVTLSGLDESFDKGVALFESLLANPLPNDEVLKNLIADKLKEREDSKKNKNVILREAMANYGRFGKFSPYSDVIPAKDMEAIIAEELIEKIKNLTSYEHKIFYYGTKKVDEVTKVLNKSHIVPFKLKPVPAETPYVEQATPTNHVYFVNFPMVQAEMMMMSKGTDHFDQNEFIMSRIYNEYFGAGLSSIVFQEIREAKALAYSANAVYQSPLFANKAHYFRNYIGTQVDKLPEAVKAMSEIVENMPVSPEKLNSDRQSILKQIETERVTKDNIYWLIDANRRKGADHDLRKDVYETLGKTYTTEKAIADAVLKFQQEKVKGRHYNYLILADKTKVDMAFLKSIGEVTELSYEDIFGY